MGDEINIQYNTIYKLSQMRGGEGSFFLAAERSIERLNEASAAGISIAAASHLVQKIIKKT